MSFFKKMWAWLTAPTPSSEVPAIPSTVVEKTVEPTFADVKPDTFEPEVKVDSTVVASYVEDLPAADAPVNVEEPKKTAVKSTAKKTVPAKITPAKKQPVKKTPSKPPAGKKAPAKKSAKK